MTDPNTPDLTRTSVMRLSDLKSPPTTAGRPVPALGAGVAAQPPAPVLADSFRALFHSLYDAGILTAADGTILDANPRALGFLGHELDDLTSRNVVELFDRADEGLIHVLTERLERHPRHDREQRLQQAHSHGRPEPDNSERFSLSKPVPGASSPGAPDVSAIV